MKLRFGFKSLVIIIYVLLFTSGMVLFYNYQKTQRNDLEKELSSLEIKSFLQEVAEEHPEYEDKIRDKILKPLSELQAMITLERRETAVNSIFYLVLMLVVSLILFLWAIYSLTSPLHKISSASKEIARGNFVVNLKEKGAWELKEALHSFNIMSSQLQRTQQQLLEAEKESIWKQFSRTLAHEIKNPLTPIRLSLERLQEKEGTPDFDRAYKKCMRIITEEVDNLQNLAMNFSRFAKDIPVNQTSFSLRQKLSTILESYEDRVKITLSGEDFEIIFDEMHFYQIVTNIIQNAIDAAGHSKPLNICLNSAEKQLTISDEGIGIDAEDLKKIFEPYFTKKKKGIGLGLALVKKLMNINKAEISVSSEVNIGTQFTLSFA